MGVQFPAGVVKEEVKKGKEPASQTVMSFFADPGFDEFEMHRARAAASVLSIRLREILREELGGTYGVNVGFTNSPPLKGYGAMADPVRQLAGQRRQAASRAALKEIERLKAEGPSADDVSKVQGAGAPRPRNQRASRTPTGSARCRPCTCYGWDPAGIARRERAHRAADAGEHQDDVPEVLPDWTATRS